MGSWEHLASVSLLHVSLTLSSCMIINLPCMAPVMFTLLHVNGAVAEEPALGRRNVGGGGSRERLM